jgi:hypothetical protein
VCVACGEVGPDVEEARCDLTGSECATERVLVRVCMAVSDMRSSQSGRLVFNACRPVDRAASAHVHLRLVGFGGSRGNGQGWVCRPVDCDGRARAGSADWHLRDQGQKSVGSQWSVWSIASHAFGRNRVGKG